MPCSTRDHEALKTDVDAFAAATCDPYAMTIAGRVRLSARCRRCNSDLCLPLAIVSNASRAQLDRYKGNS